MKTKSFHSRTLLCGSMFVVMLCAGCGVIIVDQKLFLQDLNVNGPLAQPPVHITDTKQGKKFTITPRLSIITDQFLEGRIDGHTMVDGNGNYQVDTILNNGMISFQEKQTANYKKFSGNNLSWNMPGGMLGLDCNYNVSDHIGLAIGGNYSMVGQEGFFGGNAGVGFFSDDTGAAIRLDVGLQVYSLVYEASSVVITTVSTPWGSTPGEVGFYRDKRKDTHADIFATFMINTNHSDWMMNYFLQVGITKQNIVDYTPSESSVPLFITTYQVHDVRGDHSTTFLMITPGIYRDLNSSVRIGAGVRYAREIQIEKTTPRNFIIPVLQVDWSL